MTDIATPEAPAADAGVTTLLSDSPQTTPAVASTAEASADAPQQTSTTETETPEVKAAEAAAPPEKVVPEKYEFTKPEGTELDESSLGDFAAVAKELKLSQEEAQAVINKMAPAMQARQLEAVQKVAADWANASATDKEFGGDSLPANLATAQKALNAFGTPELRQLLDGSRLGNHPEVIRFMVRAGKAISEDRMVTSGSGSAKASPVSLADALYPGKS